MSSTIEPEKHDNTSIAESRIWVENLDRSGLGSFGLEYELFVLVQAWERHLAVSDSTHSISSQTFMDISTKIFYKEYSNHFGVSLSSTSKYGSPVLSAEGIIRIRAEVYFWWIMTDDALRPYAQKRLREIDKLDAEVNRLGHIYNNPDKHQFFALDIWDEETINKCIKDGIDPTLFASLGGGNG